MCRHMRLPESTLRLLASSLSRRRSVCSKQRGAGPGAAGGRGGRDEGDARHRAACARQCRHARCAGGPVLEPGETVTPDSVSQLLGTLLE